MSDFFSQELIAQAVGIFASAIIISAFSQKSDNRFKFFAVVGNIVFALHFYMLGAYAGVVINFVNAFRNGLSIKYHKKDGLMYLFIGLYVVLGLVIYETPKDLFPIISGVVGSYGMYKLSGMNMRICFILSSLSWLVYGLIYKSIGVIITELFIQTTNAITIYRLYRENKHDPKT